MAKHAFHIQRFLGKISFKFILIAGCFGTLMLGINMDSVEHLKASPQVRIPAYFYRGGTSRGPFFLASDLPANKTDRDQVLLAIMGSPDRRQIDGMGGANPLTSKVGIVSASTTPGVDLDFLFAQVSLDKPLVDTTPNCGNMLAAVLPFAIERGLIPITGTTTSARVLTLNTQMQCDITVQTPNGFIEYEGDAKIDGVPGTSAPISINFLDTAGSVCSGLLPTGKVLDRIQVQALPSNSASAQDSQGFKPFTIDVTCIDNGMPMVLMRAVDLQRTGNESVDQMNADTDLKMRLEAMRITCGHLMGLGDVSEKPFPKMCLVASPVNGGSINTRCFIPHVCHDAIGVLAAVTVGTACVLDGSVTQGLASVDPGQTKSISVEHPSGEFTVELATDANDSQKVTRAALLRTARLIMQGEVLLPRKLTGPK
jgi:4-oxalomesaconate tautomerase